MRQIYRTLMLVAALGLPGMAGAQQISLPEISGYLNDLKSARADFTQINADGTIDTGVLHIHRPGRMRFDYDDPSDALVLASGGAIAIFDDKSNAHAQQYPLNQTPLGIILARSVSLERSDMISGSSYEGGVTQIIARDPDRPEAGEIELSFTAGPIALRSWVINGNDGSRTTVILDNLVAGDALSSSAYSIPIEQARRTGDR